MTHHSVVALVSGGKDSCFNLYQCQRFGHNVVCVANLHPPQHGPDELDSWMFQTVGHEFIEAMASCIGVPLVRRAIQGRAKATALHYSAEHGNEEAKGDGEFGDDVGDEVEDLYELLKEVKQRFPSVTAVSSGAILSHYQRNRVEHVCDRLGLVSLAYLWEGDQNELLRAMVMSGMEIILVKVASMGLKPQMLGRQVGTLLSKFEELVRALSMLHWNQPGFLIRIQHRDFGFNVCGEGGEYETITLDGPMFPMGRIRMQSFERVVHSDDAFAPVAFVNKTEVSFEAKEGATEKKDHGRESKPHTSSPTMNSADEACTCELQQCCTSVTSTTSRWMSTHVAYLSSWDGDRPCVGCETCAVLENVLKTCRSGQSIPVFVSVFVREMKWFGEVNKRYRQCFGMSKPPSRLCVAMDLPHESANVLFMVRAAHVEAPSINCLHVQSISQWAPACIGPYSQCTMVNDCAFLAGQISLDPATMALDSSSHTVCDDEEERLKSTWISPPRAIPRNVRTSEGERAACELRRSLEHLKKVAHSGISWMHTKSQIVQLIVFTTVATKHVCECQSIVEEWIAQTWKSEVTLSCSVIRVSELPRNAVVEVQMESYGIEDEACEARARQAVEVCGGQTVSMQSQLQCSIPFVQFYVERKGDHVIGDSSLILECLARMAKDLAPEYYVVSCELTTALESITGDAVRSALGDVGVALSRSSDVSTLQWGNRSAAGPACVVGKCVLELKE